MVKLKLKNESYGVNLKMYIQKYVRAIIHQYKVQTGE